MKTAPVQISRGEIVERNNVFSAGDGIELFYRSWRPSGEAARCIVLLHRGHEHSGRLAEVARTLCLDGAHCFAYDARGHGYSPGRRGDAPNFRSLVGDLDVFVRHIRSEHGFADEEIVVVANSVAAVVATAWVHDHAPRIRAMVLVAPAFSIKLYAPFAVVCLRALLHLKKDLFVKSYVRPSFLTHDREEARRYAADPLISKDISAGMLVELSDAAQRLVEDAGVMDIPTLVLSAGSDYVVREAPQRAFQARLGSRRKRFIRYPGLRHALLHERDRVRVLTDIRNFIDDAFAGPPVCRTGLVDSDHQGPTAKEFDALGKRPAPPAAVGFAFQRFALKSLGRLSAGVRIGLRHGFDSGRSLDYVYENRARGYSWMGRRLDRFYLDSPGWRGIRQRRKQLEAALQDCLRNADSPQTHIVDMAAGPGRYVLDVLREVPAATALLSDWCETYLEEARCLAAARGLTRVQFARGDAFDEARLAAIHPKADVVIASGFYELFPDNSRVLKSLRGVTRLLKPGGRLIYTNQPTHPQLEMIARVLPNRDGKPWIMRRRSQAEMNQLVESVGLRPERTTVDDQGIFTVSVARKEIAQ